MKVMTAISLQKVNKDGELEDAGGGSSDGGTEGHSEAPPADSKGGGESEPKSSEAPEESPPDATPSLTEKSKNPMSDPHRRGKRMHRIIRLEKIRLEVWKMQILEKLEKTK